MSAKIDITIDEDRVFYPGETIKGTVRFHALSSMKVQRINLQFLGLARSAAPFHGKMLREVHDLVGLTRQLYPETDPSKAAVDDDDDDDDDDFYGLHPIDNGYVLEKPFQFNIPEKPSCSYYSGNNHVTTTPLPPTMSVKENSNSAEIVYSIVLSVDSPVKSKERIIEEKEVRIGTSGYKELVKEYKNRQKNLLKSQQSYDHMLQTQVIPLQLNTKTRFKRKYKTKLPVGDMDFRLVLMKPNELMAGGRLNSRVYLICYTAPDLFRNEYIDKKGVTTVTSNGLGVLEINKIHMSVNSTSTIKTGVNTANIKHSHDILESDESVTIDLADLCPISKCFMRDYRLEIYFPGSYAMDISEFFPPMRVPESVPRKFKTCNIELTNHQFELFLDISSRSKVWTKMRCRLYRGEQFS